MKFIVHFYLLKTVLNPPLQFLIQYYCVQQFNEINVTNQVYFIHMLKLCIYNLTHFSPLTIIRSNTNS
jgi:hypothetical protein